LLAEKKEIEREKAEKLEQMHQQHEIDKERRQQEYDEKEAADQSRFEELQDQRDQDTRRFEERLNELTLYHGKIIKEMEKDQRMESDKQNDMTQKLNEEINRMMEAHRNERESIENDTWKRIDDLRNKNKEDLGKIIDEGMKAKADLTLALNMFKKRNEEKELKNNDIVRKAGELTELNKKTNALQQTIESQLVEMKERDSTIKDKDNKIHELRRKTQELEKFKFVLDYKIKELKRDIGPRETQIAVLKEKTNKMKQELRHFQRVNLHLTLIVDDLHLRQEGLTNELQVLKTKLDGQSQEMRQFREDVYECLQHALDKKKLKAHVIKLYKKHVTGEVKDDGVSESDSSQDNSIKNRKYLEKHVVVLLQNMTDRQKLHKTDQQKIMSQNVELLNQINDYTIICHEKYQQIMVYK